MIKIYFLACSPILKDSSFIAKIADAAAATGEATSSPSTASNLEAPASPTAAPSNATVPPTYRKRESTDEPLQKNKQYDFFACIGVILAVGVLCAIIMVALHFGVLTKKKYILNPSKAGVYPKLPRIRATPAPDPTTTPIASTDLPATDANPATTAATTGPTTTTAAPTTTSTTTQPPAGQNR